MVPGCRRLDSWLQRCAAATEPSGIRFCCATEFAGRAPALDDNFTIVVSQNASNRTSISKMQSGDREGLASLSLIARKCVAFSTDGAILVSAPHPYSASVMTFLFRLFGCRHADTVREHREDGWYWACQTCGDSGLLNPRERDVPRGAGRYDERKALASKARADKAAVQRRALAARLSESVVVSKARTNILQIRRAR